MEHDRAVLTGERVVLRPLVESDMPVLVRIVAEPEVAEWWFGYDEAILRGELLEDPDVSVFAIELHGEVIGVVMYSEEKEPSYRHADIDITLDTAHLGQGLGTDALRTLARHLIRDRGHHRLTIDPAAANTRAIASYRKVGFKPIGIQRRYERGPDGVWRDSLLMDLLADELT